MVADYQIAYFISAHGYGHAARAAAIMGAIHEFATTQFEIFTQVPQWFFQDSLACPFGYHPVSTDIGLVQKNSLVEDLPETLRRLAKFLPFDGTLVDELARQITRLHCQVVICDISPL